MLARPLFTKESYLLKQVARILANRQEKILNHSGFKRHVFFQGKVPLLWTKNPRNFSNPVSHSAFRCMIQGCAYGLGFLERVLAPSIKFYDNYQYLSQFMQVGKFPTGD